MNDLKKSPSSPALPQSCPHVLSSRNHFIKSPHTSTPMAIKRTPKDKKSHFLSKISSYYTRLFAIRPDPFLNYIKNTFIKLMYRIQDPLPTILQQLVELIHIKGKYYVRGTIDSIISINFDII